MILSTTFLPLPAPFRPLLRTRALPSVPRRALRTPTASSLPPHIVLLSGGVESTTLLYHFASQPLSAPLLPLHLSYSQRAAAAEASACTAVASAARAAHPSAHILDLATIDLSSLGASLRDMTPRRRAHIPIPHRNLTLLSVAVSAARAQRDAFTQAAEAADGLENHVQRLFVGVSGDDATWYPSAGAEFLAAFRGVVAALEGDRLQVVAPFEEKGKSEIVGIGESAGVQWHLTYSCMIGGVGEHCGRCGQCKERRRAMAEARVPDGAHGIYLR